MVDIVDFSADALADADLTDDQRRVWNMLRTELASFQAKNQDLLERLREYEQQGDDSQSTVLTRNDFSREVARTLAFDERYGGMTSIVYFDFEGLEETTERLGDALGNAVRQEIGSVLTLNVRKSDIVGILASDQFGVLLMRCDNDMAWQKAEILSASLQHALSKIGDRELNINISFAAYTFRDNDDVAAGLKEAKQLITRSKK
jgi:diguanylate cyclase (GGDEF)-like protein